MSVKKTNKQLIDEYYKKFNSLLTAGLRVSKSQTRLILIDNGFIKGKLTPQNSVRHFLHIK